jgi:Ca-activated chloride channel family protein
MGIKKVATGRNSKRVLVLITNGLDTNSRSEFVEARDLLRESDVVLYAVGILSVQPRDSFLPIEAQAVLDGARSKSPISARDRRAIINRRQVNVAQSEDKGHPH